MDPPPSNSGIIGILEDPNIILIILYSHYYRVGGPPTQCPATRRAGDSYFQTQPHLVTADDQSQIFGMRFSGLGFKIQGLRV